MPRPPPHLPTVPPRHASLLAWPAWQRVLAVTPLLLLLWAATAWALADATPW